MQKLFHFRISNIINNEMLLAFYMFIFPAFSRFYNNNSRITFLFIGLILAVSMLINYKNLLMIKKSFLLIVSTFLVLFFITMIINDNDMLAQYFREFILYGVLTGYLSSRMVDYNRFLLYSAYLYIVLLAVSFSDPFNGYVRYSGYMSFGLFCILPSFLLFHIQRKYYSRHLFIVPELASLVGALFSNRNTILICVLSIVVLDLALTERKKNVKWKIIVFALIGTVVFTNLGSILMYLQNRYNVDSYAIRAMINWVTGKNNGLTGRDTIWEHALTEFGEHPLLGIGIGGFHSKYGYYCHNLFIDMISSFGFVGVFLLILGVIFFVKKYFEEKNKLFIVYVGIIGFLPLLFNDYFMAWKPFWFALCFIFSNCNFVKNEK